MNDWDKILYGLIFVALVAVVVASNKTTGAISSTGTLIKQLTQNIVGVPQNGN